MLAVLIDADNLPATHAETILAWAASKAPHPLVRLFGDFSANRHAGWCALAHAHGFELVFQPNGGARKNSTDIALTIHAMDLLHEGVVTAFCLASNDRDFVPLATRLRRSGRAVFIAADKPDARLQSVCDEMLELGDRETPLVAAVRLVMKDAGQMKLSTLGQVLRKYAPDVVPSGKGRLRKELLEHFDEQGDGGGLTIVLRRSA